MITWRAPFVEHTTLANEILEKVFEAEPELAKYIPYKSDDFKKLKWMWQKENKKTKINKEKNGEAFKLHLFSAFQLYYFVFALSGTAGFFILSMLTFAAVSKTEFWWISVIIAAIVFALFLILLFIYERKEQRYNQAHRRPKI
jgi:hypothetical protein